MKAALQHALLVGAGGFVGALLRLAVVEAVRRTTAAAAVPLGVLTVNVLGCLAVGWLLGAHEHRGGIAPSTMAFLVVGVLGGFTTFSAFGAETLALARSVHLLRAALHVGLHVGLGLLAVVAGYWAAVRF